MVPAQGAMIIELVDGCLYEQALGVSFDASRSSVNRRHVKLLYRFLDYPSVREALNRAKSVLASEKGLDKGRRLASLSRHAEALPYLRAAVQEGGDVEDHVRLGRALERLERFEEALPHFGRAASERGLAIDHHRLGAALFHLGRLDDSLPHLERAVELGHDMLDEEMLMSCWERIRLRRRRTLVDRVRGLVAGLRASLAGR
ncbi:MAG: tetratricopeptide repeat protein [Deltaproteobacteria bacterium]|nr:tetratricopeptide repeat protein [Deltaproteobacteria bacterium]